MPLKKTQNRIIGLICPFLPPRVFVKCPSIRMVGAVGIEPTAEAWELSETATYAPVSVRTNMSIRKERYWLRNRALVHGAKMYVMPQLGVRISWRERCKPGPRHQVFFPPSQLSLLREQLEFEARSFLTTSHIVKYH